MKWLPAPPCAMVSEDGRYALNRSPQDGFVPAGGAVTYTAVRLGKPWPLREGDKLPPRVGRIEGAARRARARHASGQEGGDRQAQGVVRMKASCIKCGKPRGSQYKRDWYKRNAETENARSTAYHKASPHVARESMRRRRESDPSRDREYTKQWRANNPERVSLYDRQKHAKRKSAKAGGRITLPEWNSIKLWYKHCCAYCGLKKKLTMDHIVPLAKGGEHCAENIAPACINCNSSKQHHDALAFMDRMGHGK